MRWRHVLLASLMLGGVWTLTTVQAAAQSPDLLVQTIPVGLKPLGIDFQIYSTSQNYQYFAAVANSGDDSVSVLKFDLRQYTSLDYLWSATVSAVIHGIPSPYAVVSCGNGRFLVTSPSANLVSYIDPVKGTIIATVKVGAQPYSASCGLVSNHGDSSLSVIDNVSYTVKQTIPNVPGSRALHGIEFSSDRPMYWVGGVDDDVVTLVDAAAWRVLASLPMVRRPASLRSGELNRIRIASALDNTITEIDTRTLQVLSTVRDVPTLQDFLSTFIGFVATTGSGNSLFDIVNKTARGPSIPGAAGLANGFGASAFGFNPPPFLLVTSPGSNAVFFFQPAPVTPHEFSMVNGASFASSSVAPGMLSSIFATTGAKQNFYADSVPLPRTLGGVSVRVGGTLDFSATSGWVYSAAGSVDAPLLFVGPTQINFQTPPGPATGIPTPVQLTLADGRRWLATTSLVPNAPGIFTVLQNGQGQAAVLNQDNTLNFGTNPAKRGSVIQIFATGAGETTPALAAGEAAPASGNPLVLTKVQPTVTIGGKNAPVQFSGMAPGFVGLWQINAEVPADVTPGFAVPLVITAGGAQSNTVTIAVQ